MFGTMQYCFLTCQSPKQSQEVQNGYGLTLQTIRNHRICQKSKMQLGMVINILRRAWSVPEEAKQTTLDNEHVVDCGETYG